MSKQTILASTLLVGVAALAHSTATRAEVKTPGCAELVKFGQEPELKTLVPLNQAQGRFAMPAAYMGPRAEQLFGQPTLSWTPQDVAAVIKAVGDCAAEAKKARKAPEGQALSVIWQSLGTVRSTLAGVAGTEQKLEQWTQALVAAAPSRPVMVSLMAFVSARPGTAEAVTKADQAIRAHSTQTGAWTQMHSHGQTMVTMLRDVPAQSWARFFAPADKRIPEVRQWVIDDVKTTITAVPESPEGLRQMTPLLTKTKAELAAWLPPAELAEFDKAADARRSKIEDGLVAQETARIAAVPANATGLTQLVNMTYPNPVRAALSPTRLATLNGQIVVRRNEIGLAVADEQIKRLDEFKGTIDGLRDIDAFKTNTARGLEQLAGPEAAQRFRDAAQKRTVRIGEDAFPAFRKALGDVEGTEEGLAGFDSAMAEMKGPIGTLDASVRQRYLDAAQKRRGEIVAAVEKENARLVKLPLQGAVYADPRGGAKIEFRNKTRVYITMFGDMTVEGEYEIDGDRVIIRTPRSNDVFKREGAWLRNAMLNLRRVPEK